METILDELAEIYLKSPKIEQKRLKTLFHKAFRGTKKQISNQSQHPHLEFQVHLRTLLCFGYIDYTNRKNRWQLYIPTDIKLLISIYFPDVFKAPIGMNVGCGINFNYNDVVTSAYNTIGTQFNDDYFGENNFAFGNDQSDQGLFDMFDVGGCTVDIINGVDIASKCINTSTTLFDKISLKTMTGNVKFNQKKTDNDGCMQLMLSRKACLDDVFRDGLDKMNDLFQIKSNISGCNPYNIETCDITILCFDHGKDNMLNFFTKLETRYENVTILGSNCYEYLVVVTIPTKIVTINVLCSDKIIL